jgi:signal transduction histidine kinase
MTTTPNDSLILNVDDSEGARYAKSRTLTRAGFRVIEAASGGEALERAENELPDLVLLDVKLPDINGFEVCRRLKENLKTQPILVLQTSASYIGVSDKIRALEGGADNYLFEPIEPEELVANVRALLRLGQVERELREVDRRKDIFLATLAHELRNPLGPIRNSVEMLQRLEPYVPEVQENARQTIIRQTNHLVRLVDDLLDVARITQGKIVLREEPVELKTFIDAAIETTKPILQSLQHVLTLNLPPKAAWIQGDAVRLAQVVGNLLHNAAKFTPPGGSLNLAATRENNGIRISVTDNGIGIAAENASSIFELFTQAGHAPDRVQDGLGIGLSLVKAIVELHRGSVTMTSPGPGLGSTFNLWLPLLQDTSVGQDVAAPSDVKNAGRRVMIVDDNQDAANILGALVEHEGHTVQIRYNGADALACATTFLPEAVFLDIGLPDMPGYEVAVALRKLQGMENATLIALTGYGQDKDRLRTADAGFNRHVVKPIDFATLSEVLRSA